MRQYHLAGNQHLVGKAGSRGHSAGPAWSSPPLCMICSIEESRAERRAVRGARRWQRPAPLSLKGSLFRNVGGDLLGAGDLAVDVPLGLAGGLGGIRGKLFIAAPRLRYSGKSFPTFFWGLSQLPKLLAPRQVLRLLCRRQFGADQVFVDLPKFA